MRDFSFFLFNNSLGAKMKKGFRNSCNGDASTSTLHQHNLIPTTPTTTLEEMILQLDFEEEMAKREKQQQQQHQHGRMSCVNNSDILRSARNALNQYPRFSLDGRDAMYHSSFRNLDAYKAGRRSVCCDHRLEEYETGGRRGGGSSKTDKITKCLPATLGGESVVWCKPGVVAKLMGLEAIPVPLINLRRKPQRHQMNNRDGSRRMMGSCSKAGYCMVEPLHGGRGWPTGRFR